MGESKIFYSGNKKYNCTKNGVPYFRKTVTIGGKRHTVYGDGEKDANNKIEELKNLSSAGIDLSKKNAKVGSAFEEWLYKIKRVDSNIKETTFATYERMYRCHIKDKKITSARLAAVNTTQMQSYVNSLYEEDELGVSSIKLVITLWKMFFDWACEEGYLSRDPMRKITVPGKKKTKAGEVIIFTEEEKQKLWRYMDYAGYEYDTIIRLAFATGMRRGELLALKWSDVHDDYLHIGKTREVVTEIKEDHSRVTRCEDTDPKSIASIRDIPLRKSTADMLREHHHAQKLFFFANGIRPEKDYVFTTNRGTPISPNDLQSSYVTLLRNAGVEHKKFHSIRHTFATEAVRSGMDAKDLQQLLGHSDIYTTYNTYVHPDMETKRKALDRMGEVMWDKCGTKE